MARNARYRVPFRRRRIGKTNYHLRRKLVLSRKKRVVIRRSNRFILLQLVSSEVKGDKTHLAVSSKELEKYQWQGSFKNLSAAYLAGYLFGKKAVKGGYGNESLILDMGLARKFYGSRIFAALKGAIDAGLDIAHSEEIFPSEERIRGEHIAAYAKLLAEEDKEKYDKVFTRYKPEKLPEQFDKVKKALEKL